jgi:PAS domain S-box-containing protein
MPRDHLKTYIGLFIVVVLLVLALGAHRYTLFSSYRSRLQAETLAADQAKLQLGAAFIEHQQRVLKRELARLASDPLFISGLAGGDSAVMDARLQTLMGIEEWDGFRIMNPDGAVVHRWPRISAALDPDPGWCTGPNVSEPMVLFQNPEKCPDAGSGLIFLIPLGNPSGGPSSGVLAASRKISYLGGILGRLASRPGQQYLLFDRDYSLIAQAGPTVAPVTALLPLVRERTGAAASSGRAEGALVIGANGGPTLFLSTVFIPEDRWLLVVAHDYPTVMAPVQSMFQSITLFMTILFAILTLIGVFLHRRYEQQKKSLVMADTWVRRLEREVQTRTQDLHYFTERYQQLVQDLPDILFEVDSTGRVTFVSPSVQHILGLDPLEMIGRPWSEFVHSDDRARFEEEWARVAQRQKRTILALRHWDRQYHIRWLSLYARATMDAQGQPLGWQAVARDVTRETLAGQRLRELSRQLIRAQEEERRRLALDLHDEMGQLLSALKIGLQSIRPSRPEGEATEEEIQRLIDLSQKIMDRIRSLSYSLHPSILENFGLQAAIEDLCETVAESGMAQVDRRLDDLNEKALTQDQRTALFRFVQEGLTNAVKHAQSRRIQVDLKREGGRVVIEIKDDGSGFDVDQALAMAPTRKKLGLWGMMERLELVGGHLSIKSGRQGTWLRAEVVLEESDGSKASGADRG